MPPLAAIDLFEQKIKPGGNTARTLYQSVMTSHAGAKDEEKLKALLAAFQNFKYLNEQHKLHYQKLLDEIQMGKKLTVETLEAHWQKWHGVAANLMACGSVPMPEKEVTLRYFRSLHTSKSRMPNSFPLVLHPKSCMRSWSTKLFWLPASRSREQEFLALQTQLNSLALETRNIQHALTHNTISIIGHTIIHIH